MTKKELIKEVQKQYHETGLVPTAEKFKYRYQVIKNFERWTLFLEEAGLNGIRSLKYSKEQLLEIIRNGFSNGKTKFDDFKERASIFKAFGSWENALSMAGVSSNTSRRYSYSKDELIIKLLTICNETNKIPVYRETPFALSVVKAFGSWNNGLIAAGFDINKEFSGKILFSNDELASKYADFSYQIGKNIYGASKNEIDRAFREKKFPCSSGSLVNRFSGFNNLKYICGFKRWKRDVIYSREDLILLLKKKIKEYNRELTIKEINNDRELPGMKTFFSKFNTCSINEIYKIIKNQS